MTLTITKRETRQPMTSSQNEIVQNELLCDYAHTISP